MMTNVFLVIPTFPLIIVLATYAGKGTLLVILIVLVVTGWSYGANQLRAQTLSLRNRDFLESARVRGERRSYIIVFEVLPTMTSLIVANFLGAALYSVLTAAGLQFLGLGDPNSISWGTMLYWAQNQQALQTGLPLWSIAPGLCVALLGVSFALLNYAFDEISNPALRPVRRRRAPSGSPCSRSVTSRRVRRPAAAPVVAVDGGGPRRTRGRVRRRGRRVGLRQVDAAVRHRAAAEPAGGRSPAAASCSRARTWSR